MLPTWNIKWTDILERAQNEEQGRATYLYVFLSRSNKTGEQRTYASVGGAWVGDCDLKDIRPPDDLSIWVCKYPDMPDEEETRQLAKTIRINITQ